MKKLLIYSVILSIPVLMASCQSETGKKIKNAKDQLKMATKMVDKAREVKGEIETLKELTPLTNEQLKDWLPQDVKNLKRTGFKVGKTGYMNVASVEGTYKADDNDRSFRIQVLDGAGEMGSAVAAGMSFAGKLDTEEEDENKHVKTVTRDGIKARQTYYKKRNDTSLQFMFDERFVVMLDAKNMDVDETWAVVEQLELDELPTKSKS